MIDHEDRQVVTVPRWAMLECDGDARDAMVYAQITYWFQPSQRDGTPRTRRIVQRDGSEWMHLTDQEMADDLGMSRAQVQRARTALVRRGLVASMSAKVDGQKVTLVRPVAAGLRESEESSEARADSRDQPSREIEQSRARAVPLLDHVQETGPPSSPPVVVGFDDFWKAYPRHTARRSAEQAWPRALKRAGDPALIVAGAARYATDPNREDQFTAHAATWLNADRWLDDPLPAKGTSAPARPKGLAGLQRTAQRRGLLDPPEQRAVGQ